MSPPPADLPTAAGFARRLPLLLATVLAAGCSLLPEPEPAPRVYSVPVGAGPARGAGGDVGRLRVRTITPAAHLDESIAWRSGLEVGSRTDARWSERPDVVVRQALLVQLFSDGRLVRSEALDAPLLDVDLLAFEERLDGDAHEAYVALQAHVLDESRREVLSLALEARRPFATDGDRNETLASALGAGLDEVCARLAGEIAAAFGR